MRSLYLALSITITLGTNQALGSEAGMPQLNPEFWIAQIFWLTLIFIVLYLIITKIFLPKITYSIENRKSKIVNDINEADKLRKNAEVKLEEYNKIIEDSKKEARRIIEENKKKLDKDIDNKKKKVIEDIEKELLNVEKEIYNLKKSSISSIGKISTETSAEIIKQITETEINSSSVSAIVDDIIKKNIEKHI